MFKTKNVKLSVAGERSFKLEEDLVYKGDVDTWVIPAGFETDFASVPAAVQWLIPSYGKYTLAAIVHDWLCVQLGIWFKLGDRWKPDYVIGITPQDSDVLIMRPTSSRDTDAIFRRIMRELEVPFVRRWVMWTGVRWGAVMNPARRRGVAKDLPLMLVWSLIAAPVVAPVSILVEVSLILDRIFELLVGRFLK